MRAERLIAFLNDRWWMCSASSTMTKHSIAVSREFVMGTRHQQSHNNFHLPHLSNSFCSYRCQEGERRSRNAFLRVEINARHKICDGKAKKNEALFMSRCLVRAAENRWRTEAFRVRKFCGEKCLLKDRFNINFVAPHTSAPLHPGNVCTSLVLSELLRNIADTFYSWACRVASVYLEWCSRVSQLAKLLTASWRSIMWYDVY